MADLIPISTAATLVNKSEVTLRRLITAGKIPVHTEKTSSGLLYKVNPDDLYAYYVDRDATIDAANIEAVPIKTKEQTIPIKTQAATLPPPPPTPVPKAMATEDILSKYQAEVAAHAQTKAELEKLRKQKVSQIVKKEATQESDNTALLIGMCVLGVILLGVVAYILFK